MKKVRLSVLVLAPVLLLSVLAVITLAQRAESGGRTAPPADVFLSDGAGLPSTADPGQQERIRKLLELAGKTEKPAAVTIDYPQDGSVFPPEFAPPTFLWHDTGSGADSWLVDVALAPSGSHLYILVRDREPPEGDIDPLVISENNEIYVPTAYQQSARAWKPGFALWQAIKSGSRSGPAGVTFLGYRKDDPERILSRGRITIHTSSDPVGAPVFYRDVPLMPAVTEEGVIAPLPRGAVPLIQWRMRDLSRPDTRVMLEDMPTCVNCHSFSADGKTLGMDIDSRSGDKGAYAFAQIEKEMVIQDDQVITWNSFPGKLPGHKTLGFLSRVSPDGRYAISTVNEALYVQNFADYRFGQVFFPTRGILAYYSRDTKEIRPLPGADDTDYVQCDPVWSPDGKTVIFARARAKDPYNREVPGAAYSGDPNETQMKYDLYRISFNEGRGGVPEPVKGASFNGMSNSFPKVSPDGKWIVFVQSKNGQLMRPDSKLWILPFEGGEPRLMACNTRLMNSWHSFSPNGRWMVFSSKSNTPYTQMFLTHIDETGKDSPAILIEDSTAANRAVNLPEFVNVRYENFMGIRIPAVDYHRFFRKGSKLASEGRFRDALSELGKALEMEKGDSRIHNDLSKVFMNLGRAAEARKHAEESLRINPLNLEMHTNLGFLLAGAGEPEKALEHLGIAIKIYPRYPLSWYNRATLHLQLGNLAAAESDYSEALAIKGGYADAYTGRGTVLRFMGKREEAISDLSKAIELKPENPASWFYRAMCRRETGDLQGALSDADRTLDLLPSGSPLTAQVNTFREQVRAEM